MFDLQILRKDSTYKYHYFVKNLINEGDYVIDIGANLGYFSKIFYKLVGKSGKVICFEPMPPFFRILEWAFKTKDNLILYNYALGQENKSKKIYHPHINAGYFRTGLSNIPTQEIDVSNGRTYKIEMRKGSTLLDNLPKINYVKIDIEGYEEFVLPELAEILERHKPILQIETWGTHKQVVFMLMDKLCYTRYSVYKNKLIKEFDNSIEPGDYLFIHKSKEAGILNKLKEINCA
jgi:FkbM family methyltransferase